MQRWKLGFGGSFRYLCQEELFLCLFFPSLHGLLPPPPHGRGKEPGTPDKEGSFLGSHPQRHTYVGHTVFLLDRASLEHSSQRRKIVCCKMRTEMQTHDFLIYSIFLWLRNQFFPRDLDFERLDSLKFLSPLLGTDNKLFLRGHVTTLETGM